MSSYVNFRKVADLNKYISQRMDSVKYPLTNKILERILAKSPRIKGSTPATIDKIMQDVKALVAEGGHSFEDVANIVVNSIEQYPDVYGVMRAGSIVNTMVITAMDLPWKLLQQTESFPPAAGKVIDVLKDTDIDIVNALIKNVPALTQFIRDLKHTDMTLTDEQIADRVRNAFKPKQASYHLQVVGSADMPNPGDDSEKVFKAIDHIKSVNKDKPSTIKTLEVMKQHMIMNKMTAEEVSRLLKYELSRHPEWGITLPE